MGASDPGYRHSVVSVTLRPPALPLHHLIIHSCMRHGEACGLRWSDLDLKAGGMTITQQIVQIGWSTLTGHPNPTPADASSP